MVSNGENFKTHFQFSRDFGGFLDTADFRFRETLSARVWFYLVYNAFSKANFLNTIIHEALAFIKKWLKSILKAVKKIMQSTHLLSVTFMINHNILILWKTVSLIIAFRVTLHSKYVFNVTLSWKWFLLYTITSKPRISTFFVSWQVSFLFKKRDSFVTSFSTVWQQTTKLILFFTLQVFLCHGHVLLTSSLLT